MSRHHLVVESVRSLSAGLLALVLCFGCGDQSSPVSPTGNAQNADARLIVSGYVYRQASTAGEPAIADALITLRDAQGAESTALSDRRGYYWIPVTPGEVVIRAAKDGYNASESHFEVTGSTVLNFGLAPLLP